MKINNENVSSFITASTRPEERESNAYVPEEFISDIKARLEDQLGINISNVMTQSPHQ